MAFQKNPDLDVQLNCIIQKSFTSNLCRNGKFDGIQANRLPPGKELKGGRGRAGGTGCGFQSQSSGDGFTRATPVAFAISLMQGEGSEAALKPVKVQLHPNASRLINRAVGAERKIETKCG